MKLFLYFSKDARLPEQLQRAMAAEAEAAREARAKVTCRIDNRDTWENCHRMDNVICEQLLT